MAHSQKSDLFVDTSIQIARRVHGPQTKAAIKKRLTQHAKHVTSLVVRQEFKRRLLKEAAYLLTLLHRYGSFDEVNQHLIRLFGPWHNRKRIICLQTLAQVHEGTDAERTERLSLYLHSLLTTGLTRFDQSVDELRKDTQCACAQQKIVVKVPLRSYDLGNNECSKNKPGTCGIQKFLENRVELISKILEHLRLVPTEKKSAEIQNAEKFMAKITKDPEKASKEDPCLTVGDLLIAMESAGVSHFFTLNSAESQHFCRALNQTLIVHPIDPRKAEVVCKAEEKEWPEFGGK